MPNREEVITPDEFAMPDLQPDLTDQELQNLEDNLRKAIHAHTGDTAADIWIPEVHAGHYSYDIHLNLTAESIAKLIQPSV